MATLNSALAPLWKDGPLPTGLTKIMMGLVLLLGLFLWSGCAEEDNPVAPVADDPPAVLALSPDEVMTLFEVAYTTFDTPAYFDLLAPDFATHLLAVTQRAYPDLGETLDYTEETRIHSRIFSREPQIDPNGGLVPAVTGLNFRILEKLIGWGMSLDSDPIPNTLNALYNIDLVVVRGADYPALNIKGQIKFYVVPVESVVEGETVTHFLMAGQVDWTYFLGGIMFTAPQTTPWGTFKAYYR